MGTRGITTGLILLFMGLFSEGSAQTLPASIYGFTMAGLDGKPVTFDKFRGKYILIVNTASKCGYTPQYADLENLEKQFGNKVAILGFPANNFLWQESGSNAEIAEFCTKNYGVTFQMFEKVSVKGKNRSPLYKWLAEKSGETPSWNFCKYLIDKQGNFVAFYNSKVNPLDKQIVDKLQ
jgi:glutathione peroxidase